ncbi:hypothetical protein JCM8547_004693 [Rhodosporidiobolus lusitaniae]
MAEGRTSSTARAAQDDSLVVHPASQGASSGEDNRASTSPESSQNAEDLQGFWEAEEIIDEAGGKYLLSWKGVDEDGEPWKPTWEPKEHANSLLVESWLAVGKLHKKTDKQRVHDEKAKAKAKAAKEKARERRKSGGKAATAISKSRSSTSSSSTSKRSSSARDDSVGVEEPVRKKLTKRKMVIVSDSESSQAQFQPVAPQQAASGQNKKKVVFDLTLDGGEESELEEQRSEPAIDKEVVQRAVEKDVQADVQQEVEEEAAPQAASSGETSTSYIPDSQAAPAGMAMQIEQELLESQSQSQPSQPSRPSQPPQAASITVVHSQPRNCPQLNSPATSHSDLESHPHDEMEDDVPLFDPLQHNDRHSSIEADPVDERRRLGPVPVPPVAAFGLHQRAPVSSQLDPIEDPDSSPRHPPFRVQQAQSSGSPAPRPDRPAKARLELVTVEDESPASSFEAEVQYSVAATYVSLPITIGAGLSRPPGGSLLRPFAIRPAFSAAVKRVPFRPPTPPTEVGTSVGGGAVASAARLARALTPDEVVEESQVFSQGGEEYDRALELMDFLAKEFLDFGGGEEQPWQPTGEGEKGEEEAKDAGEGYPSQGYTPYSAGNGAPNGAAGGLGGVPPPSSIPGYITAPPGSFPPASYGFSSTPGYPGGGGGYPPMQLPPSHAQPSSYSPPAKREHDGEEDAASKKPRTDQYGRPLPPAQPALPPQHQPYPYPPAHSHAPAPVAAVQQPVYFPPSQPQQQPPVQPSSSFQTQSYHSSQASTFYSPHPAGRPPALNVISPSPATPAPSAPTSSFVQPYSQPQSVSNGRPSVPSPAPPAAGPVTAHRSPSPNPPGGLPPSSPMFAPINSSTSSLSRNSSPAPVGTKVDEVIALVKASPHIVETDGTKGEIEKFLRDPRAYVVVPDAPLSRSEFWAFELRHLMVEGVEKVDFIIIRSKEGNFQLKRGVVGKVPVEFARSLVHASTVRERGLIPAVDAVPALAIAAPPAPSTMTREQLEQEVERLRLAQTASEAELTTLRPLSAEVTKLRADVAALQKTNKGLQNSRDSAQSDLMYVQAQYQAASSAAVERASEAAAAEAETKRLRVLLDSGLKQKEMLHKAKEKQWQSEAKRLTKEVRFYREQSRRTNERDVREKAAKWEEHVASLRLKKAEEEKRKKGEKVDEPELDSDEEDEELATAAVAVVATAAASSSPDFVTALLTGGDVSMAAPSSTFPPSSAVSASTAAEPSTMYSSGELSAFLRGNGARGEGEGAAFRCEWRAGSQTAEACGEVVESRSALYDHVVKHVRN